MSLDKFRMAIFGDFTGRAARGAMEIGPDLAKRRAIKLDVDTVEDIIEGFATTLVLPIGKDGEGIEIKLTELDDLHPDELFEKVEMFEELNGLKQRLGMGSMSEKVIADLKDWGAQFGKKVKVPKYSAASNVPADKQLSDFQSLIGGGGREAATPTAAGDLIARVVGPHIVKAPDEGVGAMQEAVDEAISAAMRLILHHPDFQAVESTWRSVDLLARRIETDGQLEVVLYDVSAEEMAADLIQDEPGLKELLEDEGFTALYGLYTFEETPPHAELLGRIARFAAGVNAPFFTSITPGFLQTKKQDRHELVKEAWDALYAMPEANYVGLVTPRFMLRRPYGAKSEPIYEFEFEEFTKSEGLSGMLWANPVVAVAILMAMTYKQQGKGMALGSVMNLGDIPFHFMDDQYGDQIQLPCTERNLTTSKMEIVVTRNFMPLLSIKGRDEIRLGSFQSLAGQEILGPWNGNAMPGKASPPPLPVAARAPDVEMEMEISDDDDDDDDLDLELDMDDDGSELDDLLGDLDTDDDGDTDLDDLLGDLDSEDDDDDDTDLDDLLGDLGGDDDDDDTSLDDLLAGFGDDDDDEEEDDGDDDDMDAELAALLEDL